MGFERRHDKSAKPHICKPPLWRFVPWPRWGEGALWRCGQLKTYNHLGDSIPPKAYNGCGRLWEYRWVDGCYAWLCAMEGDE